MMIILNIVLAHYVHIDLLSLGVGAGDEGGWGAGGGVLSMCEILP